MRDARWSRLCCWISLIRISKALGTQRKIDSSGFINSEPTRGYFKPSDGDCRSSWTDPITFGIFLVEIFGEESSDPSISIEWYNDAIIVDSEFVFSFPTDSFHSESSSSTSIAEDSACSSGHSSTWTFGTWRRTAPRSHLASTKSFDCARRFFWSCWTICWTSVFSWC